MSVPLVRQTPSSRDLILGWATGDPKFLANFEGTD